MAAFDTAKLFMHGRSQAVRLPKEFRLPGKEVRVSRDGNRVVLEPIVRDEADIAALFARIDTIRNGAEFPEPEEGDDPPVKQDQRTFFGE